MWVEHSLQITKMIDNKVKACIQYVLFNVRTTMVTTRKKRRINSVKNVIGTKEKNVTVA